MRQLTIVHTTPPHCEPAAAYFQKIEMSARKTLTMENIFYEDAWSLCEYIDAADGGCIAMDRQLYRKAVAALAEYLHDPDNREGRKALHGRSWAANTLAGLLSSQAAGVNKVSARAYQGMTA